MEDIDFMVSCTTAACTPGRTPLPLSPPKPFQNEGVELDFNTSPSEVSQPLARPLNIPYGKTRNERDTLSQEAQNTLAEVDHIQAILKGGLERLERSCSVPPPPPPQDLGNGLDKNSDRNTEELKRMLEEALMGKAKVEAERNALREAALNSKTELQRAQAALSDAVAALGFPSSGPTSTRSKAPPPPLRQVNVTAGGRSVSPPARIPVDHAPRKARAPLSRLDSNRRTLSSGAAVKPVTFRVKHDPYPTVPVTVPSVGHNTNESYVFSKPTSTRTKSSAAEAGRAAQGVKLKRSRKPIKVVPVINAGMPRTLSNSARMRRSSSNGVGRSFNF